MQALEDLIGEYVLNITSTNLKLAALSGKIKLDNVELDGDYIGSHVIGALGLRGFGVLSCHAKSLCIKVPWKNLDAASAEMEIAGMHLVCVPLLPTTAARMYYGGGISGGGGGASSSSSSSSNNDGGGTNMPRRCSLRTRAKRSAIARFERSFFSGRVAGEGPQIEKEVCDGDRTTLNYNGRRRRWSVSVNDNEDDADMFGSERECMAADSMHGVSSNIDRDGPEQGSAATGGGSKQTLREKIASKLYQNLISSINDVHIRFEVPEGALGMSLNNNNRSKSTQNKHTTNNTDRTDQKSFAFGVVLKRLSIQNVLDGSSSHHANSNIQDRSCKTIEMSDMNIYWDDDPDFLITESGSIKGLFSVPVHKLQKRIAEVMAQMTVQQNPQEDSQRKLNSINSPSRVTAPFVSRRQHQQQQSKSSTRCRAHDFICTNVSQTIHTTYTTETSGNTFYLINFLSSKINLDVTPQQYRQYQLLQNAILSQQRFDTMLHGRPRKSPLEDPRGWWRYAILCVQHRPNSRPWKDVKQIVQCRSTYINLVVKNLESDTEQSGFHGGLSASESKELLDLENLLPIEVLLAFHLLALRRVYDRRCNAQSKAVVSMKVGSLRKKTKTNSLSRLWKSLNVSKTSSWRPLDDVDYDPPTFPAFPSSHEKRGRSSSILRQRESRLLDDSFNNNLNASHHEPSHKTKCRVDQTELRISLLNNVKGTKIVALDISLKGDSINHGNGNEEHTFDVLRFDVLTGTKSQILSVGPTSESKSVDPIDNRGSLSQPPIRVSSSMSSIEDPLLHMKGSYEENLPVGVVCRVMAVANDEDINLTLVAHPATIIWNALCADAVAEFFSTSTPGKSKPPFQVI